MMKAADVFETLLHVQQTIRRFIPTFVGFKGTIEISVLFQVVVRVKR